VYRPRSSYFFAGAIYILCAGLVGQSFFTESARGTLTTSAWCALISYAFHLTFIRPKVTFFDEGITITNPLKEITVGWDRVQEINARYSMYIQVEGEKIYAWAAQAPGRYHARSIHPTELRGLKIPDPLNMRAGESPRTHSGVAVALGRIRHEAFLTRSNASACDSTTNFNRRGLSILAILAIATLIITFA
jgi:hypothetical protein